MIVRSSPGVVGSLQGQQLAPTIRDCLRLLKIQILLHLQLGGGDGLQEETERRLPPVQRSQCHNANQEEASREVRIV